MAENLPLITKYRPLDFDSMLGNEERLGALRRRLSDPSRPHAFLFTGPSGVGKTTTARIVANYLEAEILEIDAASNSGIDAVRQLTELGQHKSLIGAANKMFIIDEAHGLSRPAMEALLKLLEEPPEHLYIALCTTEPGRFKETILTRCYHVEFKKVAAEDIEVLLEAVCAEEGWKVENDIFQEIVIAATGQPRKALSYLQSCYDAPSAEEARRIMALVTPENNPVIAVVTLLMNGKYKWETIQPELVKLDDSDFDDSSLIHAGRYIMGAMLKTKSDKQAGLYWNMLEALIAPVSTFDKKAVFVSAIGRMIWGTSNGA